MAFAYISTAYANSDDEENEEGIQEVSEIKKFVKEDEKLAYSATPVAVNEQFDDSEGNKRTNFFGIDSDSDSTSSESINGSKTSKKKFNTSHSVRSSSQTEVAVPNSDFWQKRDSPQLWHQPDKIWKHMSVATSLQSKGRPKRPADIANDRQLFGYVNKRVKNASNQSQEGSTEVASPMTRNCYFVHHKVQPYLHTKNACHMPPTGSKTLSGHSGAVNRIRWNSNEYSHLLLSVSMDRTVKIWNALSSIAWHVQEFSHHRKAVKDGLWINQGKQVLTCGYDNSARLFDVEKGTEVFNFSHKDFVTCIECHPSNPNYFMCGSLNRIICWDQRSNSRPVRSFVYKEPFGQVQGIQFINEGREFFIANDMVSRDSSDKNIMVWDFLAGVVLSNQVYHERYTCTRLKANPTGGEVLAQTNGDYIALFSTVRPYKMNKYKRFESHKVQGYSIGCDMSPDGQYVLSGSADNQLYVYDYRTSRVLRKLRCDDQVCMDVAWHPHLPATVAASTWGGDIKVWS